MSKHMAMVVRVYTVCSPWVVELVRNQAEH